MLTLADCAVTVSNATEAARWWKEKLGFDIHTIEGSGHAVLVAPPGDRFVIHLCEGFAPVEPGNSGIAFVTDELEELVRRMQNAGVAFPEPPSAATGGRMAKFADPDGNVYWLVGAPTAFVRTERARIAGPPRRPRTPSSARRRSAPKRRTRR